MATRHNLLWKEEQPFIDRAKVIPQKDVQELRQQLKDLTDAGVIQAHQTAAKPPAGGRIQKMVKFCMDYYWYNKRKTPELYNDQNVERALNRLAGNTCFHVLGLVTDLGQVPMYPGERTLPYTVRPLGFYETERLQPGYCDMLATFQVLMEFVFRDLNAAELLIFLDYVVVFGATLEEHKARVEKTLHGLQRENYKVSLEKSTFCLSAFRYFGHVVSGDGIAVAPEKAEALAKWPMPRTASELKSFLEFCGYYQHFYRDFARLSGPLAQLLRDVAAERRRDEGAVPKVPWWARESIEGRWTQECSEAYHSLKDRVVHAPVLERVNMTKRHPYQ